ncbi:hypothetical protein BH10PSE2_BH10PSE2_22190 [soil metagenome]
MKSLTSRLLVAVPVAVVSALVVALMAYLLGRPQDLIWSQALGVAVGSLAYAGVSGGVMRIGFRKASSDPAAVVRKNRRRLAAFPGALMAVLSFVVTVNLLTYEGISDQTASFWGYALLGMIAGGIIGGLAVNSLNGRLRRKRTMSSV